MPASQQYAPDSLRSRIKLWLIDHPGTHRPRDIAAALGVPENRTRSQFTVDVGRECSRLTKAGTLIREDGDTMTRGNKPAAVYRLAVGAPQ